MTAQETRVRKRPLLYIPPKGAMLQTIPAILPEDISHPVPHREYPRHLVPDEALCQKCVGTVSLSDPVLITKKAKILVTWCVTEGRFSYLSVSCVHQ